jgi:hypothetical protein
MTTTRKKFRIGAVAVTAALTLLAVFNFSAGAEKKAVSKKQRGVTSVMTVKQLAKQPENEHAEFTVKGIYAGSNAGAVLLKSPVIENELQQSISCKFAAGNTVVLEDIPLESEFVVTGTVTTSNGITELHNCRLISINIQETTGSL